MNIKCDLLLSSPDCKRLFFTKGWCFIMMRVRFSVGRGLYFGRSSPTMRRCRNSCVMSVLWIAVALIQLQKVSLFPFNCNISLLTVYFGSGKRTPWQLYSLPPNLSACVLLISWYGAREGVTHHFGADVGQTLHCRSDSQWLCLLSEWAQWVTWSHWGLASLKTCQVILY